MPHLNLKFDGPDLPEGWTGSPQDFLEFIKENFQAEIELGEGVLLGQQNTNEPTENIGVFVTGKNIKVWDESLGKYVSATDVPIGTILSWAGAANLSDPENYLLCDGRTLQKTDVLYTQLFSVIGTQWGTDGDNGFKIPNALGRYIAHSGVGTYTLNSDRSVSAGTILERVLGSYFGFDWLNPGRNKYQGAPVNVGNINQADLGGPIISSAWTNYIGVLPPSLVCRAIIRYK